jgi:hypothetical protein
MNKLLLITAALCVFIAPAYAGTVCFGTPDSCGGDPEHKVFLEAGSNSTTGFGNCDSQAGVPVVDFSSGTEKLDYKNGWANIDPHGSGKFFQNLDITVPGYDFTDLVYSAEMYKNKAYAGALSFTITVWDDGSIVGSHTYSNVAHDTNIEYDVTGLFDEVSFYSQSGFKEMKQFELSGLALDTEVTTTGAAPEPSAWAMGIIGFAMLGAVGWRKRHAALGVA